MPQDIELEENVRSAPARDPRVDHDQAIAAFANAGVVTLRGSVRASSSATANDISCAMNTMRTGSRARATKPRIDYELNLVGLVTSRSTRSQRR